MLCGDGQKDVWRSIGWKGFSRIPGFCALCLASLYDLSLPIMFVIALTLRTMMLCLGVLMAAIMCAMRSLIGWLYWQDMGDVHRLDLMADVRLLRAHEICMSKGQWTINLLVVFFLSFLVIGHITLSGLGHWNVWRCERS